MGKNPGRLHPRYFKKEKVLTVVGAFFVSPETVSALSKNQCPFCIKHRGQHTPKWWLCFKSENEIEKPQGFIRKRDALKTTPIKKSRRPGSKCSV